MNLADDVLDYKSKTLIKSSITNADIADIIMMDTGFVGFTERRERKHDMIQLSVHGNIIQSGLDLTGMVNTQARLELLNMQECTS